MLTNASTMRARELERMRSRIAFAYLAFAYVHIEEYEELRAECERAEVSKGELRTQLDEANSNF